MRRNYPPIGQKIAGVLEHDDTVTEQAPPLLRVRNDHVRGIPVAWIPWFWIPDPSQPRALGPRMPSVGLSSTLGATLTTPYFVPVGDSQITRPAPVEATTMLLPPS